jgi:uncharacterized damage-inducible protein DinB
VNGDATFPRIEITPYWRGVQDDLVSLIDLIPDEKMNWSPTQELWSVRAILLHVASARQGWLDRGVKDGEGNLAWENTRTKDDIKRALDETWRRLQRFVGNEIKLDDTYVAQWSDGTQDGPCSGHWIAFHLLEHDIHHRADVLHYLALLGVDTSQTGINV